MIVCINLGYYRILTPVNTVLGMKTLQWWRWKQKTLQTAFNFFHQIYFGKGSMPEYRRWNSFFKKITSKLFTFPKDTPHLPGLDFSLRWADFSGSVLASGKSTKHSLINSPSPAFFLGLSWSTGLSSCWPGNVLT